MKGKLIILIAILVLAAILRLWSLGSVPPSTSMDEASIGYNAYSLLKTGGDEYKELPILSHRAYDDWRRATYLYLVVPFVALFDLNVISVRLPAVVLSILTILATYHIALSLFSKRSVFSSNFALLTSFLLAISPWHIYISRLGHESNASLAFLVFGILFFLQGQKDKLRLLFSIIFFTLSLISYYSGQAFIPLFVIGLFFIFREKLLAFVLSDKKIIISFLVLAILLIPIFKEIFSPEALIRFQGTSVFRPEAHLERFNQRLALWSNAINNNDIIGTLVYNKYFFQFQVLAEGYLSHFKPEWLFANSGAQPHKVPNMGLLYLWELPLIIIGFLAIIFSRLLDSRIKKLIFLWLFLAPLPAAIATQTPHAMRSYSLVVVWQIFAAFGLVYILTKLKKFQFITLTIFGLLVLISLVTFYKNYFIVFPREQSNSFHYVLSKAIPYVLSREENYQKIVFSNKDNLYQSYMLFLYYSHYDPLLYQKQGGTKSGGFAESHQFGKYEFRSVDLQKESMEREVLYVVNAKEVTNNQIILKTFNNLDGVEAIKILSL